MHLSGLNDHIQVDFNNSLLSILGGDDAAANLSGVRALFSGDGNGVGQINTNDKYNYWRPANGEAYEYFFSAEDYNLDKAVNSNDKNFHWRVNNGKSSYLD